MLLVHQCGWLTTGTGKRGVRPGNATRGAAAGKARCLLSLLRNIVTRKRTLARATRFQAGLGLPSAAPDGPSAAASCVGAPTCGLRTRLRTLAWL